jgi:NADH:ubiquinone oxidoreductase subunit 2 (subunit N)
MTGLLVVAIAAGMILAGIAFVWAVSVGMDLVDIARETTQRRRDTL